MSKHHSPCASLSLKAYATAAGKTILFGEYAVIFGHKAYVQALPLRTHCLLKVMPTCTDFGIKLNLLNLGLTQTRSYQQLYDQYQAIKIQYSRFLAKEIPISHVLTEPSALIAAVLIEGFDDFFDGIEVVIASDVMPQSGQGSSAALIVSALLAINTLKNKKYRLDDIFHQAVKLECFQHGISSGLDVAASLYGGLASYQNKKFKPLSLPAFKFYLISTGKPFSTTGDCVALVKQRWMSDHDEQYNTIDCYIDSFLMTQDTYFLHQAVLLNHKLLVDLGVVPLKVQNFIHKIEKTGGVAKISGSGTIFGDNAGMVVAFASSEIEQICHDYGYGFQKITGVGAGVTGL